MTTIRTISQLELTLTEIAGTIFSITGNDTFILTADNGQNFFVDLIDELNTSILALQVGQSIRITGFVNLENNRLNLINTIIINDNGTRPPPPILGLQTISGTVGFVVDDNQFILNSNGQIYFVNLLDEFNAIALNLQPNQPLTISGSVNLDNGRIDINTASIVDGANIPTPPPFIPDNQFPPGSIIGNNTPEFIQGTPNNDTIFGLGGNDTIDGQAGDDSLFGSPGSDSIFGGMNNDTIFGNEGTDTIDGENGDDSIIGNQDNDILGGGDGNDTLQGNEGSDEIDGGGGDDSIIGNIGSDTIDGNAGNDTIAGNEDSDSINGSDGNDSIDGNDGNDSINGGIGNDIIAGNEGNDTIDGNDGNDSIFGNKDSDRLLGNGGNDTIYGGKDNDVIDGGFDLDFISGDLGNDELSGGEGDDLIFGGRNDDFIYGGGGNDTLSGDLSDDTIVGENGNDFIIAAGRQSGENEIDFLTGGVGVDTFVLGNSNTAFYSSAGISDYAVIVDFNTLESDAMIIFSGSGIVLGAAPAATPEGTGIFVDGDLIAVVIGATEQQVNSGLILI